jgi:hypothetical protein
MDIRTHSSDDGCRRCARSLDPGYSARDPFLCVPAHLDPQHSIDCAQSRAGGWGRYGQRAAVPLRWALASLHDVSGCCELTRRPSVPPCAPPLRRVHELCCSRTPGRRSWQDSAVGWNQPTGCSTSTNRRKSGGWNKMWRVGVRVRELSVFRKRRRERVDSGQRRCQTLPRRLSGSRRPRFGARRP